jgi:hypothetical protein
MVVMFIIIKSKNNAGEKNVPKSSPAIRTWQADSYQINILVPARAKIIRETRRCEKSSTRVRFEMIHINGYKNNSTFTKNLDVESGK